MKINGKLSSSRMTGSNMDCFSYPISKIFFLVSRNDLKNVHILLYTLQILFRIAFFYGWLFEENEKYCI